MHVTVCICTRNRGPTIAATLRSLIASSYADFDVVIIDQSTREDTAQAVQVAIADDPRFSYLHSATTGKTVALNIALGKARGSLVAFTDDDCEVQADWLSVLVRCFEAEPEVGMVSGALIAPKRRAKLFSICPYYDPPEALYDPIASGRQAPAGWSMLGANVAFRRSVLERVGSFDECLGAGAAFPAAEETDYIHRLEAMGIKMRSTPRAVVYHTYGYRYGLLAVARHKRNYIRGNAGLAGKLTLSGDVRGQEWVAKTKAECTSDWFYQIRSGKLLDRLVRLWIYLRTYHECLRDYQIDPVTGCLTPLEHAYREVTPQAIASR